jgi:phosphatidyl-myo-inositol alpha-mannosyltransferase
MSPLRVGLVSPYDLSIPGGVQAQVLGLAQHLRTIGDEPTVIGPGLPIDVEGIDLGSSLSIPGNGSKVPLTIDPRVRGLIRSGVKELDLLHVHEPLMPLASILAVRSGPPVVATFHAGVGPWGRFMYRMVGPVLKQLLGNTEAVTAVSDVAASVLPPEIERTLIPNGVAVEAFQSTTDRNPKQVAFIGRDEPRKGLNVLLEAWPRVRDRVPDAELVVINARRDTPGIRWLGPVDDETKRDVLASSGVFVAPHIGGESFGIVIVEAMAAGAAVIASDLPAFRSVGGEIVEFFPTGDAEGLADAVTALLADETEMARRGASGRIAARRFDWTTVGAAYREVYLRVVD